MILSAFLSPVWVLKGQRITLLSESFLSREFSCVCTLHSVNSVFRSFGLLLASSTNSPLCFALSLSSLNSLSLFFWTTYVNSFLMSSSSYSSKILIFFESTPSCSSLWNQIWLSTSSAEALLLGAFCNIIFIRSIDSLETMSLLYSISWFTCST